MADFEWDDVKAEANRRKHGVSFETAVLAFSDPFAVEWIDARESHGEERTILVGLAGGGVLTVVYAERGDRVRIISARRATRYEQDLYHQQRTP